MIVRRVVTVETPPLAWGRPSSSSSASCSMGNTPTRVGKTAPRSFPARLRWKHPHSRGEDLPLAVLAGLDPETPPLAWGRLARRGQSRAARRNTPTRVGKTTCHRPEGRAGWKHPHSRGEDSVFRRQSSAPVETPPLAWGRPTTGMLKSRAIGNTPTRVGKTGLPCVGSGPKWKHPHSRGEDRKS